MNPRRLMTQRVQYRAVTGATAYGDPEFGNLQDIAARVESKSQIVVAANGDEQTSRHTIATLEEIPLGSRVWLPGDNCADIKEARRPISIQSGSTPNGRTTLYLTFL